MKKMLRGLALFVIGLSLSTCSTSRSIDSYVIGIDPSWFPLSLPGQEKNVVAFSTELLVAIGKKTKLQFTLMRSSWNVLRFGLENGTYDAVLGSLRPYPFYQTQYQFSNPYLSTGPILIVPTGSGITKVQDLQWKWVGVIQSSSAALILQRDPGIILRSYQSIPHMLDALSRQEIHGAAVPALSAKNYIKNLYPATLTIIPPLLTDEGLRLIARKGKSNLLIDRFNRGLAMLQSDGTYDALLVKWNLGREHQISKIKDPI